MGIVYHSNYLIWMEVGRVEYCRAKGILYRDMEAQQGILLVVAEANCRYSSPALFDEEVLIRTRIGDATPRMVRFEYEMRSGGDARLAGRRLHQTCFLQPRTQSHQAARRVPARVRHLLEYLSQETCWQSSQIFCLARWGSGFKPAAVFQAAP